ncbi:hypothetical protein E2C01_035934 [Portunus trituberculatus]|uniref:Uncharacterized protein n=1 Tax=Portunus trituberculatus TaxID=210409 RepID=A0A5B7F9Q3_PORTR|nr:hypothetical protein [Portunus trituberculatus]
MKGGGNEGKGKGKKKRRKDGQEQEAQVFAPARLFYLRLMKVTGTFFLTAVLRFWSIKERHTAIIPTHKPPHRPPYRYRPQTAPTTATTTPHHHHHHHHRQPQSLHVYSQQGKLRIMRFFPYE